MSFWNTRQFRLGRHKHLSEDILTEEGEAAPTSGEVSVLSTTVTLTDAQIKALPSTPVEIIAPTELNPGYDTPFTTLPVPLFAVATFDNTGGLYGNVDSPFLLGIAWGAGDLYVGLGTRDAVAYDLYGMFSGGARIGCFRFSLMDRDNTGSDLGGNIKDNGLYLACQAGGGIGPFTGGNAANTMKVTVVYTVVAL